MSKLTFKDIRRGDTFRVYRSFVDEWFYRGEWMKIDRKAHGFGLAVCLTQGNNHEGETREWNDDIPVEVVKLRHPCSRSVEGEPPQP